MPVAKETFTNTSSRFIAKLKDRRFNDEIKHMLRVKNIYIREIHEIHTSFTIAGTMYYASLRVAPAPPRVPDPGDTDFDWSHGGEAFLFLWFTTVTRDGRFLAPTGYPARQGAQELPKITSRHVSLLRSATFIFKRTRIVHSLINCLSRVQLSYFSCTTSTKRPMFQEVMFLRLPRPYLTGIEIEDDHFINTLFTHPWLSI